LIVLVNNHEIDDFDKLQINLPEVMGPDGILVGSAM